MKDEDVASVWRAVTCHRFGLRRLGAQNPRWSRPNEGRDKSQPAKAVTGHRTAKGSLLFLLLPLLIAGCTTNRGSQNVPVEVESTINRISEEIAAERYEKVYNEASELWRQDLTLEQTIATFKTLRQRLGNVETRTLMSATEQQNSGGALKGHAYFVTYRTKFQNAEGMETFTLVERDGRWLLARYLVNSTALK